MPDVKMTHTDNGIGEFGFRKYENLWQLKLLCLNTEQVFVNFYINGEDLVPLVSFPLKKTSDTIWLFQGENLDDLFYDISILRSGEVINSIDPYSKLVTANAEKGKIAEAKLICPEGWEEDTAIFFPFKEKAIIYEMHIRDFTIDESSGVKAKGKYLGAVEQGSKWNDVKTGIDHLKELGITHVQLMPVFDFNSVDETYDDSNNYNWGYDPFLYNAPEGSYSLNSSKPEERVLELKKLIQTFHQNNIGVIMDVVYNHTSEMKLHPFQLFAPDIFYRFSKKGKVSNGSGCGNELASERIFVRDFIISSLLYWSEEFHIDGFRFDLMGLLDIETLSQIDHKLKMINPNILLYGEGWCADDTVLSLENRGIKRNSEKLVNYSFFSDEFRDGVKGSYAEPELKGFVSGNAMLKENVKFGIVGGIRHPQVAIPQVTYSDSFWASKPTDMISYVSCHDNHTLFDKLQLSNPKLHIDEVKKLHCLAVGMVICSQGIPFLHSGVEFLRSKNFNGNSYNSSDAVNSIKWSNKKENYEIFEFHCKLINFRKNHPAFSIGPSKDVKEKLVFVKNEEEQILSFQLGPYANGDAYEFIWVIFNVLDRSYEMNVNDYSWTYIFKGIRINEKGFGTVRKSITIEPRSMQILYR